MKMFLLIVMLNKTCIYYFMHSNNINWFPLLRYLLFFFPFPFFLLSESVILHE